MSLRSVPPISRTSIPRPDNDDHDNSEDDESPASFTISTVTNVFDFGDLPDVYGTLTSSGGPSHRRGTSTNLGLSVDDEGGRSALSDRQSPMAPMKMVCDF